MNKKLVEIILNSLFWMVSSWLILSLFSIEAIDIDIIDNIEVKTIKRSKDMIIYLLIGQVLFVCYFYTQMYLVQKHIFKSSKKRLIIMSILAFFSCILLYYMIVNGLPFGNNIQYFSLILIMFYAAIAIGYSFIKVWIISEQQRKQLELVKNKAELNLLKQQLHPHFLFNTMNNLLSMVDQENHPKLAKSIDKLSNLLRYVVYETKNDKVSIVKEIDFVKNFAALNLLRYEDDEVDFNLKILGNNNQQLIASGILLCFIENAFNHSVQPELKSFIHVTIDLLKVDIIAFKIENSIPPKTIQKENGGYGLKATKDRLNLVYANNYSLDINHDNTFTVILKIHTNESNNS
jgi:sensor histidine kinase YesM